MICIIKNWRITIGLLWTFYTKGKSSIVIKPVNTEVRIGDSTYLNCSISDYSAEISWQHYPAGEDRKYENYVYLEGQLLEPYDKRFHIEKDKTSGSFNLVVKNVELRDAGLYVCQNGGGTDSSALAEIVVLESEPVCHSNINPSGFVGPNSCSRREETIRMSCSIKYKGNVPPTLNWTKIKDGSYFPINESLLKCSANDGFITCDFTEKSDLETEGSTFICHTNRSKYSQYNCSTSEIRIHYAIGDKNRITKTVGDTVTCLANTSSHNCTYKWIWFDGMDEETLSLNERLKISRDGWHRCEANCDIKDFQCQFSVVHVKAYTDETVWYLILGGGVFLSWIALAVQVYTWCRLIIRRRGKRIKETRRGREVQQIIGSRAVIKTSSPEANDETGRLEAGTETETETEAEVEADTQCRVINISIRDLPKLDLNGIEAETEHL